MAKAGYVGVGGVARKLKKMYVGIGGVARKLKKLYVGINGVARLWWQGGSPAFGRLFTSQNASNGSYYYVDVYDLALSVISNHAVNFVKSSPNLMMTKHFLYAYGRTGTSSYGMRKIDPLTLASLSANTNRNNDFSRASGNSEGSCSYFVVASSYAQVTRIMNLDPDTYTILKNIEIKINDYVSAKCYQGLIGRNFLNGQNASQSQYNVSEIKRDTASVLRTYRTNGNTGEHSGMCGIDGKIYSSFTQYPNSATYLTIMKYDDLSILAAVDIAGSSSPYRTGLAAESE